MKLNELNLEKTKQYLSWAEKLAVMESGTAGWVGQLVLRGGYFEWVDQRKFQRWHLAAG
jgi:hypothetical protein